MRINFVAHCMNIGYKKRISPAPQRYLAASFHYRSRGDMCYTIYVRQFVRLAPDAGFLGLLRGPFCMHRLKVAI